MVNSIPLFILYLPSRDKRKPGPRPRRDRERRGGEPRSDHGRQDLVASLTSNLRYAHASGNMPLRLRHTGRPKDSVANLSQIVALDRTLLTEHTGKLPRTQLDLVPSEIDVALGRYGPPVSGPPAWLKGHKSQSRQFHKSIRKSVTAVVQTTAPAVCVPANSPAFHVPQYTRRDPRHANATDRPLSHACYPFSPLSWTPSTMRRLATRKAINKGTALSAAPAMMGP